MKAFRRKEKPNTDPPASHPNSRSATPDSMSSRIMDGSELGDVVERSLLDRILRRKRAKEKHPDVLQSGHTLFELQNSSENDVQRRDAENPHAPEPSGERVPTAGVKDSIVPNLSAVLNVVQQVGKILESVPFIEPIGAILSVAVDLYKEVDANRGKRDVLSENITALSRAIAEAGDQVDNLQSDVNDYREQLDKVQNLLAVRHNKFDQIINRGKYGADLESLAQSLDRFAEIFKTKCLIDIRKTQHKIVHAVTNTQDALTEFITGDQRKKIIEWLSPINFFTQQEKYFSARHSGTGEWFLADERFRLWEDGSGSILWGRGIPGAGKTVLASVAVEHLTQYTEKNIGVACIYLNYNDVNAQTSSNLLAAVWRQLVWSKPIASKSQVEELFQVHYEKDTKPKLAEIYEVLRMAVFEWSKVYIVVDALDETPEDNRLTLLDHLANLGPTVCLMLTSRHDVLLPKINAKSLEIRPPPKDVQKYVAEKVNNFHRLNLVLGGNLGLRDEIIAKTIHNVNGMFLLARLHVESFEVCTTIAEIRTTLETLSGDLPRAYDKVMDRIDQQPEQVRKVAYSALIWVANAKRALSVNELREALAVEWGEKELNPERRPEIKVIISVCAGLLVVTGHKKPEATAQGEKEKRKTKRFLPAVSSRRQQSSPPSKVRLVHSTTQEYLDGRFPAAPAEITRSLLTYLKFKRRELKDYCQSYCLLHWQSVKGPEEDLRNMILDFLKQAVRLQQDCSYAVRTRCPWDHPEWPESASPLWVAAASNLQDIVKYLLDRGTHPNSSMIQEGSPLCAAAFYGHVHIAKLLVERGADINSFSGKLGTALYVASLNGHVEFVRFLLESGADISTKNSDPLEAAVVSKRDGRNGGTISRRDTFNRNGGTNDGKNSVELIQLLLKSGANVNAENSSALRAATKEGRTEVVRILLEHGANASAVGDDDCAVLDSASWSAGNFSIVRLLLEHGADVHANNDNALATASWLGHTKIVEILLEYGANANAAADEGSVLGVASSHGHAAIVRLLLSNGADVDAIENIALRYASQSGRTEVVQILLEHGANANAAGEDGPVLEVASALGYPDVVRLLVVKGADVHAGNDGALRAATSAGHTEVVKILLGHGANADAVDESELEAVTAAGHTNVVRLLLENCADVHTGVDRALEAAAARHTNLDLYKSLSRDLEASGSRLGDDFVRRMLESYRVKSDHQRANDVAHTLELVGLLLENKANVKAGNNGALQAATDKGYPEVVEILLNHGADPNAAGKDGSVLMVAAARGSINAVRFLLKHGADIHATNDGALRASSEEGHIDIVGLLLKEGSNENAAGEDGSSALEVATSKGHIDIVHLLVEKGANIHAGNEGALRAAIKGSHMEIIEILLKNGASTVDGLAEDIVKVAAVTGHTETVRLLLENGANVREDGSALISAVKAGHIEIVEDLLKYHANTNAADEDYTVLEAASGRGHIEIVLLLLKKGADVHGRNDGALIAAVKADDTEILKVLLEYHANTNAASENIGVLETASGRGHIDIVRLLLQNGADPHAGNDGALKAACQCWPQKENRAELVRLLLEYGADVHAGNGGALRAAAERGHTDIIQILLERGAIVNAVGADGTALQAASSDWGHIDAVRLLLENGADVHGGNDAALRAAAEGGHTDIVQILLEKGANVNAVGEEGSALQAASSNGRIDNVRLLLKNGADVHIEGDGALEAAACYQRPAYWNDDQHSRRRDSAARSKQLVSLLLEYGADVSARSNAALRAASKAGHTEVVQILLEHGADATVIENAELDPHDTETESQRAPA